MFSEQDVDRELKAALSAAPSPDFEARVLQRVEADRPVRVGMFGVGRGLTTRALPIAASIVIAAGLFYAMNRTPAVVAPPAAPPIVERTAPPAPKTAPMRPAVEEIAPPRVETVHALRRAPRTTEPEVIVPMNQMEAVRRLVRAVNEGRITAPTEPVESVKAASTEVTVAPLVVDPIPVPGLEPGADAPSPIIRGHQ